MRCGQAAIGAATRGYDAGPPTDHCAAAAASAPSAWMT